MGPAPFLHFTAGDPVPRPVLCRHGTFPARWAPLICGCENIGRSRNIRMKGEQEISIFCEE